LSHKTHWILGESPRKDLEIQALELLIQSQPPSWPKKGLVLW